MWKYPALLCLIYALSCGSWAQIQPTAQAGQTQSSSALKLADGTPIKLRVGQMLSSADAQTDGVVRLEVVEDVCVGNSVVIFSGTTELNIFSEPFGAEIDLDGAFIGNTPFRVIVPSGQHLISLRLAGYGPWKKMISAAGGSLEVDADLSPGGINGDVVSHCSTADCVDSSVSNVAKKPNQKQVRQAPTPPQ